VDCRLCGKAGTRILGEIPDSDYFAGRVLGEPIRGGWLWGCDSCQSMFRHPILTDERYLHLYECGAPTQWGGGEHRLDCRLISSILSARPNIASVLDVGCGGGDFLVSLPQRIGKFGVEPAVAAARNATARGVSVIAPTIDGLPDNAKFDAVTMIDLIEHLTDPGAFLSQIYSHVLPGGIIVVSTGNPGNRIWRALLQSRFWYCGFPEHVSFPSLGFFQRWCESNPGASVSQHVTRYQRLSVWGAGLACLMQTAYFASPSVFDLVGRLGLNLIRTAPMGRRHFVPAIPGLFRDHHVVTITRPADS